MEIRKQTVRLAPSFRDLNADRSSFQRKFVELVSADPRSSGKLLDIGCGGELPDYLTGIAERASEHDGVDPSEEVMQHPGLGRRWHGFFEQVDVPTNHYDIAMAYNVLEHIPQGAPFFRRVAEVLRPGGSFWALTPHSQHPFAWLSNTVRWLNVKRLYRSSVKAEGVNAYASYYRLNSPRAILKQLDPTLFESVTFYRLPCTQWDRYFPAVTRFIPHLYDRAIGQRVGSLMLLLAVQLVKKS